MVMKVAILGFGTVGRGAYETTLKKPCDIRVKRILDLRVPAGYEGLICTDYEEILRDPEIEIVAEVMGGLHPAYEYVTAALRAGKHVVSANKHLICTYYRELRDLAAAVGRELRFTPAAGGGIPWLFNLQRAARCDEILSLRGIMNGTTNYILDAMQTFGSDFGEVLAAATELGYAERDPSADIDGTDVCRKCAISASLAFGTVLGEADVPTFGIRRITAEDIRYFASVGLVCKLLAFAFSEGDAVSAYVEPTLLPADAIEAAVGSNFNCISLVGRQVGCLSFMGQGAGAGPTGSALVSDMLDIAAGVRMTGIAPTEKKVIHTLHPHRYYVRTTATVPTSVTERRDGGTVITRPLTRTEMHALAEELLQNDSQTFVAGMEEDIK